MSEERDSKIMKIEAPKSSDKSESADAGKVRKDRLDPSKETSKARAMDKRK